MNYHAEIENVPFQELWHQGKDSLPVQYLEPTAKFTRAYFLTFISSFL
jgi:hypothetical protein